MATEQLDIRIREDGSVAVSRNIENIGAAAQRSQKSVSQFGKVVAGIATGVVVSKFVQFTSAWTDLRSRVVDATKSMGTADSIMNELMVIANRTYNSFTNVTEIFLQASLALNELGFSTQRQLRFTEALSNALVISGAKGEQAEIVFNALTRAMSQGVLNGTNLRMVFTYGSGVVDALAQGLGKTTSELRAMGEAGELTGEVIERALGNRFDDLRERAEAMPATIKDMFVIMNNEMMAAMNNLDSKYQFADKIVKAFEAITSNVDNAVVLIKTLSTAIGSLKPTGVTTTNNEFERFIYLLTDGNRGFVGFVTVVLRGFDEIIKSISNTAAAFMALGDTMEQFADRRGAAHFEQNGIGFFDALKASFQIQQKQIGKSMALNLEAGFEQGLKESKMKGVLSQINLLFAPKGKAVPSFSGGAGGGDKAAKELQRQLEEQQRHYEDIARSVQGLIGQLNPLIAAQQELIESENLLNEAMRLGIITMDERSAIMGQVQRKLQDSLDPMSAWLRFMEEENALLKLSVRERDLEAQTLDTVRQLREQGLDVGEKEMNMMRQRIQYQQQEIELMQVMDSLREQSSAEILRNMNLQLESMRRLTAEGALNQNDQYQMLSGMLPGGVGQNTEFARNAELASYEMMFQQIETLRNDSLARQLIAEQDFVAMATQIRAMQIESETRGMTALFGTLSQLTGSGNKTLFKIGKAAAIAQAMMNTYVGATKAMAEFPGPMGYAMAAATVAAGLVQVANIRAQQMPGYATGGYTGDIARDKVAGMVHGQEYVVNAQATRKNRSTLEAINRGESVGGNMNVVIQNYAPGVKHEVQQVSPSEYRVIAREEARAILQAEGDKVMANNIGRPSSQTSRAMGQYTTATRNYK